MSESIFTFAPIEVVRDSRLDLNELRVLLCLLSFRDEATNFAMPQHAEISSRSGIDPARVSAALAGLSSLGWLRGADIDVPEEFL